MIEIKNVSKQFKEKTKKNNIILADDNISLKVPNGSIVGVLGPNGAGKTTLLRMIAGILTPTNGTILYDDVDISTSALKIKNEIAYLSGNTKLYNSITGRELLKMFADIYGVEKEVSEIRIEEIIKRLDLSSFIDKRIGVLSTGQTQRINIARCLVHKPKYYILDEATSGLDIISSQVILDFIKEEKKNGASIIYSTHYMEEAQNLCSRVALMDHGKLEEVSTPSALINSLGNYTVDEFSGDETKSHYFHTREEAIAYLSNLSGQASLRETTLEDVFVERAGRHLMPS